MKTREEIKRGLECCTTGRCSECPYDRICKEFEGFGGERFGEPVMTDALALIQQLEAQVPKWISVDEKQPEDGDVVFVIANSKPRKNITLHNAVLIASYWKDEGWIADGFEGWDGLQVTQWMPLPELQKEGI